MEYDFKKNYYQIIGISKKSTKKQIQLRLIDLYNELRNNNYSDQYIIEEGKLLKEAEYVLLNDQLRAEYDAKRFPNSNNNQRINEARKQEHIKEQPKRIEEEPIRVVKKDEKTNYSKKGLTALVVASILSLTTGLGLLTGTLSANRKNKESQNQVISSAISTTTTPAISNGTQSESSNDAETYIADAASEATTVEEVKETSEDVAKKVWSNVQKLQKEDPSYAPEISENNILNLVKWAKHEGKYIDNASAWGELMELAENPKFNLADITDGLDIDESMNKYIACFDGVSENGTLVDENNMINDISNMAHELDTNSIVVANMITAEMYAKRPLNQEIGMATNTIDGELDDNLKKTLNTISEEDRQKNNEEYTVFIDSYNNALDASDQEDLSITR